jgi:hypothetical protein
MHHLKDDGQSLRGNYIAPAGMIRWIRRQPAMIRLFLPARYPKARHLLKKISLTKLLMKIQIVYL